MAGTVRLSGIVKESIVDGPGIRLVVFAQGCGHRCPGCHNPDSHSFAGGTLMQIEDILKLLDRNPLLDGITLSGGEPFDQAADFAELAERVKAKGLHVMTYTGYTYEELTGEGAVPEDRSRLLRASDILVDGRFELEQKSLLLKFRGSKNQRIIDVASSLAEKRAVLADV